MRLLLSLNLFTVSLFGQTLQGTGIRLLPPSGGGPPGISFQELKVNGTNTFNLYGPNNLATTLVFQLPNSMSPGAPGTYWGLCADNTGIFTWCTPSGAGAYIDTTTNQAGLTGDKTTNGQWDFLNTIRSQNHLPVTNNLYSLGDTGHRWTDSWINNGFFTTSIEVGSGTVIQSSGITLDNSAAVTGLSIGGFDGVGPVVNWSGRFRSYKFDGVTIKAGIGHLDTSQWESINGFTIGGNQFADGSRNTIVNNLNILGTCTGCSAISNYVTTNTNQISGNSGNKLWSGAWQFEGAVSVRGTTFITYPTASINEFVKIDPNNANFDVRRPLSSGAGNALRVQIRTYSGLGVDDGFIATLTGTAGFETIANSISTNGGIYTTVGFSANGSYGYTLNCLPGQTIRDPEFIFGIMVNATCGI